MKKYLFLLATIITMIVSSCKKEAYTSEELSALARAKANKTWKIVYLTEVYGKDTVKWDIAGAGEGVQNLWAVDLVWGDGIGYSFPPTESIGHGRMYRPLVNRGDPNSIKGKRVLQEFTWYMLNDKTTVAKFGSNTADILVLDENEIILHQLDGDVHRWYRLSAGTYGWGMGEYAYFRPY